MIWSDFKSAKMDKALRINESTNSVLATDEAKGRVAESGVSPQKKSPKPGPAPTYMPLPEEKERR